MSVLLAEVDVDLDLRRLESCYLDRNIRGLQSCNLGLDRAVLTFLDCSLELAKRRLMPLGMESVLLTDRGTPLLHLGVLDLLGQLLGANSQLLVLEDC